MNPQQAMIVPGPQAVARIDEIAGAATGLFADARAAISFREELAVAQAINDMRAALTPEVMAPLMALMNSDLGFRTDRDPMQGERTGRRVDPYPVDVVRECFIEAKLRGFRSVGNEWNIISGRFYAAKNGLRRKVLEYPGLTDYREVLGLPRVAADKGGATVHCRATWKRDGIADALEDDFPIRLNSYMGADAILGKAQRKLLARVYHRLGGIMTPEGEASDEPEPAARQAPARPATQAEMLAQAQLATANQAAAMQAMNNVLASAPNGMASVPAEDAVEVRTRPIIAGDGVPVSVPAERCGTFVTDESATFGGAPIEVDRILKRLREATTEEQVRAEVDPIKALSTIVREGAEMSDYDWAKQNYFAAKKRLGIA